ncbi:MAG: D-alanyl-D-alanine carboxypeptidase, partial [Clostridiales bacterium]|nr:D-alanyl-D-alanine carboxypeptidase [Clostridiales bacterium]
MKSIEKNTTTSRDIGEFIGVEAGMRTNTILRKFSLVIAVVFLLMAFFVFSNKSHAVANTPDVSAQAIVLLECSTNTVLYSKSAHVKLPMASTTKVMTALVAIRHGNLDTMVEIPDEAIGVEGSSIFLQKGEKLTLRDLLYGLMLRSGNDAAIAIAYHFGGSIDGFAMLMNETAKSVGAMNTNFVNPHGLPAENHYTTAYDLALICSEAIRNETFKTIVSAQYHRTTTGYAPRTMMNKNKLLWDYEGGIGIKTGFTKAAGKCLTFAAERNGMTVVGVVLNCPNMFPDAQELLNYSFYNYEMYVIVRKGTVVLRVDVDRSNGQLLPLV